MTIDSGWNESAQAYIAFQDAGDRNRTLLLDPVMLDLCGDVHGRSAVDIGCGEGRFSRMLSERGASVVGIDVTPTISVPVPGNAFAGSYSSTLTIAINTGP